MILHAFPPHTVESVPAWNNAPLRSWRWAVCAERWAVGAEEQMRTTGAWHGVGRYVSAGLSSTRPASGFYQGDHDWWTDVFAPAEPDRSGAVASFIGSVLLAAMEGDQ